MPNPTPKKIETLTRQHIARYEGMKTQAAAGNRSVHVEDCDHYLAIWRGIEAHAFAWEKLAPFQKAEVMEALTDDESDRWEE